MKNYLIIFSFAQLSYLWVAVEMGLNSKSVKEIHPSASDISNKVDREGITGGQLTQVSELTGKRFQ